MMKTLDQSALKPPAAEYDHTELGSVSQVTYRVLSVMQALADMSVMAKISAAKRSIGK